MTVVVAIDGPAGSGKSSVSRSVARELGFDYLDTGAAYRGLAWRCMAEGIDTHGPADIIESLASFVFTIGVEPNRYFVEVGSEDVTDDIRLPSVTALVSNVARVPEVREHLTALFRTIIHGSTAPGIVVEGRDITTVVAPDAAVRILLTASEEARMERRSAELSGESAAKTARELSDRDKRDLRVVDFMNAAKGVTTLDSTALDFDQTVAAVVRLVRTQT